MINQTLSLPNTGETTTAPSGYHLLSLNRHMTILIEKQAVIRNVWLFALLVIACVATLSIGTMPISPKEVIAVLFGHGNSMSQFIVADLRLPRLLAALFTGAAFSLAGCLMQTMARNRLATPGIIGIDNAAMAFAVSSIVGMATSIAPSFMALAGAATATALAFGLAGGSGTRGYRFIVAGIGIGAIAGAITQLLLSQVSIDVANSAYPWTVGSLSARDPMMVKILGIGLAFCLVACIFFASQFALMPFSDQVITGLGANIKHIRVIALILCITLTGLAVAVAGPVGLVALVGPEIARVLARYRGIPLISSALTGALVMILADLFGRTVLSPIELPVGIVTAVIGGPYLIWILVRRTSRTSL
ncbi:iron ABC transporter permease [Marinomonas rhizomae]|uniref:Iron complex transport system permease protein n=1 Tax=Marinomonas rhizomae TaxID=491948 RepID=A0A366JC56_9GAMM|nr:iron ABC transporter permease [Marinomonas rhizomae]RBP84553.1 iron complex transport system permease protein [Marinomonas rhizomae]RNF75241.1 iron ABC transporter permease [Marinomonas rhizomae]